MASDLQSQIETWCRDRFGDDPDPKADGLIIAEEAGEVCRAILKRQHGQRGGTFEHWSAEIRKEAADVVIALYSLAANEGFDLDEAIRDRWAEVSQRTKQTLGMSPTLNAEQRQHIESGFKP
jgi:NTP pyrophosphatase (non-canonical NTP hydrolase)